MFENWEKNNIIPDAKWYSHNVYLKLCMHDALPHLDWITYIDCDTLVYDNIDNFLLEKDYPFPIAAPVDLNYDLDFDYAYFCTAVFKTSLKYWRENSLDKFFIKGIAENWEFVDQDILNRCFKHNRTILPLKYSTQHIYENSFHYMRWLNYAKIIHFGGPFKPTNQEYNSKSDWFFKWKNYEQKHKDLIL
jgi:lipopolysaccharide biosynthesis glycosyltransferase